MCHVWGWHILSPSVKSGKCEVSIQWDIMTHDCVKKFLMWLLPALDKDENQCGILYADDGNIICQNLFGDDLLLSSKVEKYPMIQSYL